MQLVVVDTGFFGPGCINVNSGCPWSVLYVCLCLASIVVFNLRSYPGSRRASSAWRPGDRWPARCPVAPAPWWPAPVAEPGPGKTAERGRVFLFPSNSGFHRRGIRRVAWGLKRHLEQWESFHLSSRVAVVILVVIPHGKFLRVLFLDRLVGHFFTHSLKREANTQKPTNRLNVRLSSCDTDNGGHTASISLRIFHCSYGTPSSSAVWMVRLSWLVQTFRSDRRCSSTKHFSSAANWQRKHMKETLLQFWREVCLNTDSNVTE